MICGRSNIYGSMCSFSCHHGYNLEGSVNRMCEKNGTIGFWTGNETKCRCKDDQTWIMHDFNLKVLAAKQCLKYVKLENILD